MKLCLTFDVDHSMALKNITLFRKRTEKRHNHYPKKLYTKKHEKSWDNHPSQNSYPFIP